MRPFIQKAHSKLSGLSLVEVLIAMVLMSLLMLSVNMTVSGLATNTKSLGIRNRASMEILTLINQMRDDIQNAVRIDDNSFSDRLVLHLLDTNGVDYLKAYKIENVGGKNYLRVGTNLTDANDVTASKWSSPYIVSAYDGYALTSGQFLFCGREYNCSRITDTNANGLYEASDTETVPAPYQALDSAPINGSPMAATRVVLSGFVFDAGKGNPSVTISVPDVFVRPRRLEWATIPAEYSFYTIGTVTSDGNNDLPMGGWSGWQANAVCYDSYYDRLLVVGVPPNATARNRIFSISGWGLPVNYTLIPNNPSTLVNKTFNSVSVTPDGRKILLLDSANDNVYVVTNPALSGGLDLANKLVDPDHASNTSVMGAAYSTVALSGFLSSTTARAIAFTPKFTTSNNPDGDFYVVAQSSGGGADRLYRRKLSDGLAGDNSVYPNDYPLPAGLTNPTSMFVEPVTGTPYIVNGAVYTSGSDKMLDIYKIDTTNTTTSPNTHTIPINLSKINSGWAWATGQYSVGYDYRTNHIYLLNDLNRNIHRFPPDRTITPLQ